VPAGAQPKDPPVSEEAAKERARVLLEAGNQLSDSNDHLGALEMFRQARAAYPSIFLHINIGVSLWILGRYTQALDELEAFLAAPDAPEEDKVRVREQIAQIEPMIGILTLTFTPPAVTLTIAGRTVKVTDGRAVLRFDPGEHLVVVSAPGYASKTHKVGFKGGEAVRPLLAAGAPAFSADGVRLGVRGAAGLEWRIADWIGITGEVGVEHYPSVPDDHVKTLFAPSVGVQARR
jgi:hypothetical protein